MHLISKCRVASWVCGSSIAPRLYTYMYICVYIYICVCIYIYIYLYIYKSINQCIYKGHVASLAHRCSIAPRFLLFSASTIGFTLRNIDCKIQRSYPNIAHYSVSPLPPPWFSIPHTILGMAISCRG